jgi:glycosyltransferase involved in cell wall biosynthesis
MDKKKILYIHHGIGIGGAPLSLLYLIQNLDKTKYHPIVLFLHNSEVVDLYKSKGIEVVGPIEVGDFSHTKVWWYKWYHPHHLLKAICNTFQTIKKIAPYWFEKIKPDIVHLNTSTLIAWGKVAYKKGIHVVWHIREPLACGYLGLRRRVVQKFVEKYSTIIMPICKNDSKPWKSNPKLKVVYNAVDTKLFNFNVEPFQIKDCENNPKILFLGGLSKEKGTLVIFEVFKKLLNKMPSAKLIVAGYFDNNEKIKIKLDYYFPTEKYKRKVNKTLRDIEKSVIFLGPIKNVPQVMAASDVIVFPATVGHFARPIIEAGFMKRAVVASNLPPLDELVIDGKTGFLIDPKNFDLWADKLFLLLNNEKLKDQMGCEALDFCKKRFDVLDQIKKIQNVYEEL